MPFKNPHPLYHVWASMRDRCHNPNNRQWNDYGGRGVSICSRWDDFHVFVDDMGDRPKGYSLDRIDNDSGYSPENCRWASRKEQQRNQRRAVYVEIGGERYRAIELAEIAGVKTDTILRRVAKGLPYELVISKKRLTFRDGLKHGPGVSAALRRKKATCPHGHPYTEANTIYSRQGWRRCRKCFYEKEKRLRRQRRERAEKAGRQE